MHSTENITLLQYRIFDEHENELVQVGIEESHVLIKGYPTLMWEVWVGESGL